MLGRPEAATAQKLWIIAAGSPELIERCRPLMDTLGRGVTVVGREPWQANLVKLASNFIIVSLIETLGEAFALMRKAGISVHQFLEMANTLFGSPIAISRGVSLPVGGRPGQGRVDHSQVTWIVS